MEPANQPDNQPANVNAADALGGDETGMFHATAPASESVSVFLSTPKLIVRNSSANADEVFALTRGKDHMLGRLSTNDIFLNEQATPGNHLISRQHAVVTLQDSGSVKIKDLGGRNGTYVNGERLAPQTNRILEPGDRLGFGGPDHFAASISLPQQLKEVRTDERMLSHQSVGAESLDMQPGTIVPTDPLVAVTLQLDILKRTVTAQNLLVTSLSVAQDRDQMFERLSEVLTQIFDKADRCTIFTTDERGVWSDNAVSYAEGADRNRPLAISRTIITEVNETGKAVLSNTVLEDMAASASLEQQRISSIMCCPFRYDGKVVGLVQLDAESGVDFTAEDLQLLAQAAYMAEISNTTAEVRAQAERNQRVIDKVGDVQSAGLPQPVHSYPGVEVAFTHNPLEGGSGDFYDIIQVDDQRTGFLLFDVAGHDSASALWGAMMSGRLNTILQDFDSSTEIESALPKAMAKANDRQAAAYDGEMIFATGIAAVFDPADRTLEMVRAGHDHMMVYNSSDEGVEILLEDGPMVDAGGRLIRADDEGMNSALCVMDSATVDPTPLFSTEKYQLKEGDIAFGFTDGFFELENDAGEQFGKKRLAVAFEAAAKLALTPEATVREVHRALLAFVGDQPLTDDVSGFVLQVK